MVVQVQYMNGSSRASAACKFVLVLLHLHSFNGIWFATLSFSWDAALDRFFDCLGLCWFVRLSKITDCLGLHRVTVIFHGFGGLPLPCEWLGGCPVLTLFILVFPTGQGSSMRTEK